MTSELSVRQPPLLVLLLLLLQNEIHVLANVVNRFPVAHRAPTLLVALGERVRRLTAFAEDATSKEELVACQLRFVLLVEGLLLRFRTTVLGALLHHASLLLFLMLVGPLQYLVNVFDETHSILILTF